MSDSLANVAVLVFTGLVVAGISTAREARLVTATNRLAPMPTTEPLTMLLGVR